MNPKRIEVRNRMIRALPMLPRLAEIRHVLAATARWRQTGWESPPPFFVKRAVLLAEARAIGAEMLVETGTFLGDTSWAMRSHFRSIHTIEVAPVLAELARKRFATDAKVKVIEGDSQAVLPELCRTISNPCLFYLDGHYSGGITGVGTEECPVLGELTAILSNTRVPFRVVIDDARLFGTNAAYPTVDAVADHLCSLGSPLRPRVENDAIILR